MMSCSTSVPAVAERLVDVLARAERGDRQRHLVLDADFDVVLEAVVGLVHDLVDRERRRRPFGMRFVVGGEFFLDAMQPFVEQLGRARVERRECTDDAGLALRDDQFRPRNDELRRADQRQAEFRPQLRGGHGRGGMRCVGNLSFPGSGLTSQAHD